MSSINDAFGSKFILPKEQPLPPPHQFTSPLKRQAIDPLTFRGKVACDLFGIKRQKIDETRKFVVWTPLDQVQAENREMSPLLRAQLAVIEHGLKYSSLMTDQRQEMDAKIMQILDHRSLSEQSKLVELGILYYCLVTGKSISTSTDSSLLTMRLEAIEAEVRGLKENHKLHFDKRQGQILPSGTTAYLLRTFARMIFPPDGGFNLGGCYALKALLNTRLNLLLKEEMRSQILNVSDCLLNDPEFLQLFLEPFEPHPSMKLFICLDLKIPFAEEMNFVYVRWSMLTALFSVIGQIDEGNCYAVAKTMNLLNEDPKVLLKLLIQILQNGHFAFEDTKIPILPLLESRRNYAPAFRLPMTSQQARGLVPYAVASVATQSKEITPDGADGGKRSLKEWMEIDFSDNVSQAKEFFLSHKLSFLQQALLATMQFASLNSLDDDSPSYRVMVLGRIMKQIREAGKDFNPDVIVYADPLILQFMDRLSREVSSHFFLIDYTHWDQSVKEDKVVFDYHSKGFVFNGNLEDYTPFRPTRRLFYESITDSLFVPIDSLTGLGQALIELVNAKTLSGDSQRLKDFQHFLLEYLQGDNFRQEVAEILVLQNQSNGSLGWEEYYAADSFFLLQDGGDCEHVKGLDLSKGKFADIESISASEPEEFFVKLCTLMDAKMGIDGVQWVEAGPQPLVMAGSSRHAFNLTPWNFQKFWKNPSNLIKKNLISPGACLAKQPLSYEQIDSILKFLLEPEEAEQILSREIPRKGMTVSEFKAKICVILTDLSLSDLNEAINMVVQEFGFPSLKNHLPRILNKLGLNLSYLEREEVLHQMEKSQKIEFYFSPFEAARLIQKALQIRSPSIFIPVRTIENAVRKCHGFPWIVEIGNQNWVDNLSASPKYSYLSMTYDVSMNQIVLCKGVRGNEMPLPQESLQDLLNKTDIYFNSLP